MALPPGVVDPLFLHELALELKMGVEEMCNRMSAAELTRDWPLFFQWRARESERQAEKQNEARRTFK